MRLRLALRRNRWQAVGLVLFVCGSLLVTLLVAGTLRGSSGPSRSYEALFTSASGLAAGDDVRIAGVRVGSVEEVTLDGTRARVRFSLSTGQTLRESTTAGIEFLNLLGQRYVDLQGIDRGPVRRPGTTIPLSQTHEGLDLSAVFNAFRPLFEMITPQDVNELAGNIVQVLQGQGPTLRDLTSQTARLTRHLVAKDEVIGRVIDNLTVVMETMSDHRTELRSMVRELNGLTGTVADNRQQIGATIDGVQGLVTEFAGVLDQSGGDVIRDVDSLAAWADSFADVVPRLASGLSDTKLLLEGYIRSLGLGSFLNVYVCDSKLKVGAAPPLDFSKTSPKSSRRCS